MLICRVISDGQITSLILLIKITDSVVRTQHPPNRRKKTIKHDWFLHEGAVFG